MSLAPTAATAISDSVQPQERTCPPAHGSVDMSVDFAGLRLVNPVFTASGTCGYGPEYGHFLDLGALGGFVTKSVTPEVRVGNRTPRIVETHSGMLNAIGLANVGLERFVAEKVPALYPLATRGVRVFANVAGKSVDDYRAVARGLANIETLAGLELNISCPNVKEGGISFGTDARQVFAITRAIRQVLDQAGSQQRLMVKLSPNVTDIAVTARAAIEGGAHALSLVNTFTAMTIDIHKRTPRLANGTGGLSGPAIKPIAVYMVHRVYSEVTRHGHPTQVPILGLGGVQTWQDAAEFMIAGASAIAIGTQLFIDPTTPMQVLAGLGQFCVAQGLSRVSELTGSLQTQPPAAMPDVAAYTQAVPAEKPPADL